MCSSDLLMYHFDSPARKLRLANCGSSLSFLFFLWLSVLCSSFLSLYSCRVTAITLSHCATTHNKQRRLIAAYNSGLLTPASTPHPAALSASCTKSETARGRLILPSRSSGSLLYRMSCMLTDRMSGTHRSRPSSWIPSDLLSLKS